MFGDTRLCSNRASNLYPPFPGILLPAQDARLAPHVYTGLALTALFPDQVTPSLDDTF